MKPRTTIRDVARAVGVSHTTVSMALRNDPRILAATRKKVAQAAVQLGYRRDPVISELMAQLKTARTRAEQVPLAFMTAWPTRDGWRQRIHFVQFFASARSRAAELGFELEEFWLREPGMTPNRMTSILRARGIRGIVLLALAEPEGSVSICWRHFATVTKGLTVAHPRMHRVVSSHYDDMRLAVAQLVRRGYRRLGFVLSEVESKRVGHAWLAGYYLHQHTVSSDDWVPALFVSDEKGEAQFDEWYKRYRPEVVLFAHQPLRTWLTRLGLAVPRQVGLVDLVWSPENSSTTGIDLDPDSLGAAAIDLLVGQLEAHEYGVPKRAKIVEVMGRWVPGKTILPSRFRRHPMIRRPSLVLP